MSYFPKLLIIVGPTSSGKSELAVQLAKKFNGEIISADSRQIYRGLDLGTGKINGKWHSLKIDGRQNQDCYFYKRIRHHCIDFVNPAKQYSAGWFQADAKKAIADVLRKGKLPILCGGTAHWVDAVVYDQQLPNVDPNPKLRARLEKKSAAVLFKQLQTLDKQRASTIDRFNKRRLIRALEIISATGKPVPPRGVILKPSASEAKKSLNPGLRDSSSAALLRMTHGAYNALWIGIKVPQPVLYKKIDARLKQRIKQGLVKEVRHLHQSGLSWKRLQDFGLEYKYVSLFLQKKLSSGEMFTQLSFAIKHYSKRQLTWWKRNKEIKWIADIDQAPKLVEKFLR